MSISDKVYKWKYFEKTVYTETNADLCSLISLENTSFEFIYPYLENSYLIDDFCKSYDSFTIDKKSKKLIDHLVTVYSLKESKESLYGLAAAIQSHFINIYNNPLKIGDDVYDLEMDYYEYKTLFGLIEIFVFGKSLAPFKSVTIDYNSKIVLKSSFVYKTILYSLVEHYRITKDNFHKIKKEELSQKSSLKLDKLPEFNKSKYIFALHQYITEDTPRIKIINKNLKFIACFLLSSQIPISKLSKEIILPDYIKDVEQSDIVNLRKYLNDEKKLFINI